MPRNPVIATLLASAAALTLGAGGAAAQEVTLRMHYFLPAQATVPATVLEPWADRIEEASGGRIEIQRYPAMQLGGTPPELYDQVVDGVADIVWTLPGYTPGRFPRTEVFELPFTMTNAEATSRAFWQLGEETMLDQDFSDVHVLALWVHGPGVIHSSEPIEELADLDGVTLRAPTRITNTLFSNLGATAIGMPVPAIPEALSQGVIDGTVLPWEVTGSLRTSELVSNHTEFGGAAIYTATFVLAMNQEAYDGLPDDLRAILDENSGLELSAEAGRVTQEGDEAPRAMAVDLGNTIVELAPEQVDLWREAAQSTTDDWIAEFDAADMDGTGLFARAQELIAENTGE